MVRRAVLGRRALVTRPGRLVRTLRAATLAVATIVIMVGALEVALRFVGFGHPLLYDNRAAYGYRPLPNQTLRRLFGARVHVNAEGLRGPGAPAGALRLLFLGDSVTWGGSYVDDRELFATVAADTVARRLPGRFPTVAALDAGVNAWGPQNILGLVAERGGFGSPIWILTLLDDDFRREKTRIGEVPYFNAPPTTAFEELLVLGAYRVLTAHKREEPAEDGERIARENLAACRAIYAAAQAAGSRVLVVWHPSTAALAGEPQRYRERLLDDARAAAVETIDLTGAYRSATGLYVDGLHLSAAGHGVAGTAIGERLVAMLSAPQR
jgi:hypothetical protein